MKHLLVGTAAGAMAYALRERFDLLRTAVASPERVGTVANDQLAMRLACRLCHPDKLFIDVGAHIGSIVSAVLRHNPAARVVAVEAMPDKVRLLRRKFPSIELHGCAVGPTDGDATFFVSDRRSGYSALARSPDADPSEFHAIQVPLRRMDSLVSSDRVDLVKIDVVGAELGVLQGSEALVARNRPIMVFESGPARDDAAGSTHEALWAWLEAHDYAVVIPNRLAHDDPGLERVGFLESHLYPRRTTNYFAVPTERRLETRDAARRLLKISA